MDYKITSSDNITTAEALGYIARLQWIVVRNIARAIDTAAHKFPWAFIVVILLGCFVTSFVCIADARSERDALSQKAFQLEQSLDSCQMILEVRK